MNKTLLRRSLVAAVVIAVLAGLTFYMTRPKPVAVLVAAVEPGRVEATVANTRAGSVEACRRAKLAPPLGGRIDKLLVRAGDRVKTGQVLVELWNDDLAARERISVEQLQSARARVNEACLLADTARTVVKAPFDGIVAEVNGEVGEYLTPSPPGIPTLPAVDLIDDSCLYVSAPIDEVDAAQLKIGMAGRISLDAYRGRHFGGKLRRIAPYVLALEKQARTVEVEVEFDTPGEARHLLVGYSADIEVVVDARDGALRIPTTALMPGSRVLLLNADGLLEERKIEAGLSNWEFTEVKGGLARGDRVVTSLEREGVKAGAQAAAEEKPASKKP
ncbi:MAG: efflux RND transporter periplasmic adaptor subunit [Rhodocyclaceae bacterium]|nr:efflux RND transporter periplasmic adaptor subunit [Rhodocyclaceae bacterium]